MGNFDCSLILHIIVCCDSNCERMSAFEKTPPTPGWQKIDLLFVVLADAASRDSSTP